MAWFSSLILTSIFLKSIIVLCNPLRWSLIHVPSFIWRVNNHFFKYKWSIRNFVRYKLASSNYNLATTSSSATSWNTSLPKHNKITLGAFSISSSFSSLDFVVDRVSAPFNALANPYWTNKARNLMCHKLKKFLPSNFSTSNFVVIPSLTF